MKPFQLYWDAFIGKPIIFDGLKYWVWFDGDASWAEANYWYVDHNQIVLLFEIKQ